MLYCEKARINCDNYGGAITLDIVISGEKKKTMMSQVSGVRRITESTQSPSQIRVRVRDRVSGFFLIVEKGHFSTLPFRFEKFES